MSDFTHDVVVYPAYNNRSPENPNGGRGHCRIVFILKGTKGAIQFMVGTTWAEPNDRENSRQFYEGSKYLRLDPYMPKGWDVGYHSHTPHYEGQGVQDSNCHVLGGPCYYDGSSLMADDWIDDFVRGGTAWLWPRMEQQYRDTFEGLV